MNVPVNLFFLAATIYMEAENQSYLGKLAVGHVVLTTAIARKQTIARVVLTPWFISSWNTDAPTRRRLSEAVEMDPPAWEQSMKAAASVFYGIEPDPTGGATNYLNVAAVKKLPTWYDKSKVVKKIDDHEFLKL